MLYIGMMWWHEDELPLLQLRAHERPQIEHVLRIAQATTTFRGSPREVSGTPLVEIPDADVVTVDTSQVVGAGEPKCAARRRLQRNATFPDKLYPDDVFIFTDLDEVVHREDWTGIVAAARRQGFIRLRMRNYAGKINQYLGNKWAAPFAVTGKFVRTLPKAQRAVDALRRRRGRLRGRVYPVQGQHFSWLVPDDDWSFVEQKDANNSHPKLSGRWPRMLPNGQSGKGVAFKVVPVDDTYPSGILENLDTWRPYIACPSS